MLHSKIEWNNLDVAFLLNIRLNLKTRRKISIQNFRSYLIVA
jgi:hypothetical protein